jgi:hypothetical protein
VGELARLVLERRGAGEQEWRSPDDGLVELRRLRWVPRISSLALALQWNWFCTLTTALSSLSLAP